MGFQMFDYNRSFVFVIQKRKRASNLRHPMHSEQNRRLQSREGQQPSDCNTWSPDHSDLWFIFAVSPQKKRDNHLVRILCNGFIGCQHRCARGVKVMGPMIAANGSKLTSGPWDQQSEQFPKGGGWTEGNTSVNTFASQCHSYLYCPSPNLWWLPK